MKNPKLLLWVAIVSIALNLALLGFFVGQAARPLPNFDPTRGYAHWVRTLPENRQAELRPLVNRPLLQRPQRRGPLHMRRLHQDFRQTLTAEPFDQAALSQALATLREGHATRQAASHTAFVNFVAALTPVERQALAEDLARTPRHPRLRTRPGPRE